MPRRNFICIMLVGLTSLVCFERSDRNPYGRHFAKVIDTIENDALLEISQQELFNAGVEGLIARLHEGGDQHSAFYSSDKVAEFNQDLHQEFVGVGIRIDEHPSLKQPVIIAPVYGSPADKAGIRAGDVIIAVDGHPTKGEKLTDVTDQIKGNVGEPVTLSVLHPGAKEPLDIEIYRGHVVLPTILGDVPGQGGTWSYYVEGYGKIAYVRMLRFSDKSSDDLKSILVHLQSTGMQALILDLRGNPGGRLDVAIEACDLFFKEGVIVSTRDRRGEEDRPAARASGRGTFTDFPLVVMVNRYSASASEIVAACLQDHDRALIAGQRSYGKGTVQNVISIEAGASRLKLTTSSFWRPSGKQIHRAWRNGKSASPEEDWGVIPDDGLLLKIDDDERYKVAEARHRRDYPQAPHRPARKTEKTKEKPDDEPQASDNKDSDKKDSDSKDSKDDKPEKENSDPAEKPAAVPAADEPWPQVDRQLILALEYLKKQLAE